ncbi:glutamate--tRNA ligase [Bengtsoniella intestinalis]|uniref:glutamate--tRNA ligase n=1 Tax=Bengtsoniella intestinalis TaxID=3073143 RepID=UPI00391F0F92
MSIDAAFFADLEARIPTGTVRTRFAPSPTGYMHVGNLRTALYTWLIARNAGGTFILRIEDTDQVRLIEDATAIIYKTMAECGLTHDEGPDVGGPVGPYVQTDRRDLYGKFAELLIERGHAYRCFCDKDDVAEVDLGDGVAIHKYDGRCSRLSAEEIQANLTAGKPYVIRQKIPTGTTTFHDVTFGDITVDNDTLDDQVLMKRDGLPTYNFANVIDDHLMGITHVVRGSEYLSSAPKYNLLYEAYGWDIPAYVHCSPVMRDATHKMSKRHGDPSYEDLIAQGYLTDAVLNYVALLGWSPKGDQAEQEIFSLEELAKAFDIAGISKSPAIFDTAKLDFFNATYLRNMTPEAFAAKAEPYIRQSVKNPAISVGEIAALLQARCEKLTDIPEKVDFFDALPDYGIDFYTNKKSKTNPEVCATMLKAAIPALEAIETWTNEAVHDTLMGLATTLEVKNATLLWPVRIAAAGKMVTPGGATEICHILGKEETLRRLNVGLAMVEAAE